MTSPSAPYLQVFSVAVALVLTPKLAYAGNDSMRVTRLTSADFALMVTNVCLDADPTILRAWDASLETIYARAQQVKDEVSAGLDEVQLSSVLRRAADAARATALREVDFLRSLDPEIERNRTLAWCAGPARAMVEGFMKEEVGTP